MAKRRTAKPRRDSVAAVAKARAAYQRRVDLKNLPALFEHWATAIIQELGRVSVATERLYAMSVELRAHNAHQRELDRDARARRARAVGARMRRR